MWQYAPGGESTTLSRGDYVISCSFYMEYASRILKKNYINGAPKLQF